MTNNKLHVILQSRDNPGRLAHFKFGFELGVDPDFRGPLSANERIAYEIAELMDLPVMPVQFYRHLGLRGHLRWAVPFTVQNWSFVDFWVKRDLRRYFRNPDALVRMFVFDVFVCNHDRHEGNVLYTISPASVKHEIYLIDHDLALYGTERKWRRFAYTDPHWFNAGRFLRLNEVAELIKSYDDLRPSIEMALAIPDHRIDQIVDGVRELEEGAYLSDHEADVIKNMLRIRKNRLEATFREWCEANGKI